MFSVYKYGAAKPFSRIGSFARALRIASEQGGARWYMLDASGAEVASFGC